MLQLDLFVPRLFHSIVSTYDDTCRTVFIVRLFLVSINNNKPVRDGVSSRSRGSTKRAHWRVNGETKHSSVRLANKLARRLAYMLVLHEKKKTILYHREPLVFTVVAFQLSSPCPTKTQSSDGHSDAWSLWRPNSQTSSLI